MKKIILLLFVSLLLTGCYVESKIHRRPTYQDSMYDRYFRLDPFYDSWFYYYSPSYRHRPYVILKPKKETEKPKIIERRVEPRKETNTSAPRITPQRQTNTPTTSPQRRSDNSSPRITPQRSETRSNSGRR
jgi:hypothetical protein